MLEAPQQVVGMIDVVMFFLFNVQKQNYLLGMFSNLNGENGSITKLIISSCSHFPVLEEHQGLMQMSETEAAKVTVLIATHFPTHLYGY